MIKNASKNTILSNQSRSLTSALSKGLGLMFRSKPNDTGWIFEFAKERIISLHMFFVFFPIDVLWLDKNKKVVELKKNFRPFTFYTPSKKARYVLEFSAGTIQNSETCLGDKIEFSQ